MKAALYALRMNYISESHISKSEESKNSELLGMSESGLEASRLRLSGLGVSAMGEWKLFISLNLYTDIAWWSQWSRTCNPNFKSKIDINPSVEKNKLDTSQTSNSYPSAMLLLSESLPLGWAVMLRDQFVSDARMDKWTSREWLKYLHTQLQLTLAQEATARKRQASKEKYSNLSNDVSNNKRSSTNSHTRGHKSRYEISDTSSKPSYSHAGVEGVDQDHDKHKHKNKNSSSPWEPQLPVWLWSFSSGLTLKGMELISKYNMEQQADMILCNEDGVLNVEVASKLQSTSIRMSALLAGRSLLQQEVDLLLKEHETAMPNQAAWHQVLQLAYLEGRVALTSAVAMGHSRGGRSSDGAVIAHRKFQWLRLATAIPRSVARRKEGARCRRCGSEVHVRTSCGSCGSLCCAYCEACLALGRSKLCALLVQGSAGTSGDVPPNMWRHIPREADEPAMRGSSGPLPHSISDVGGRAVPTDALLDRWGLSPAQRAAAGAALDFLQGAPPAGRSGSLLPMSPSKQKSNRFLLWAVTGAGKTEMIFPLLASVLESGGKALVATPRRDVVLELSPRLQVAFPNVELATLYGGSSDRFKQGNLVVATTHQLMRFTHCFDVVVIDELDAFPYHNDPMLAYAAERCCKPDGKFILLSATPPSLLQREVAKGILPHAKVPARFHGHPLPVPKYIRMKGVELALRTKKLPVGLITSLRTSVQRGAQIFVFVSRIRHIAPLITVLQRYFPTLPIDGTSSEDNDRAEKVMRFRACEIRLLVTTTILERGVTVKKSDVYILDADSDLFDEASLVQMSGRAGRSSDDPAGLVIFSALDWTKSQRKAIAQIKQMNTLARKRGYLK